MRALAFLSTPRGASAFMGAVVAIAGLVLALADSKHAALGLVVIGVGAILLLLAVAWVKLSVAVVRTAASHGVLLTAPAQGHEPTVDLRTAARFLATELGTAKKSVARLLSEGQFPRGVTLLPTQRWQQYEDLLANEDGALYTVSAKLTCESTSSIG